MPGTVLTALCASSTYPSPQPHKVGTSTLIPGLNMEKLGFGKLNDLPTALQSPLEELGFDLRWSDPTACGLNHCGGCLGWRSAIKP